jgi:hypothetical protein
MMTKDPQQFQQELALRYCCYKDGVVVNWDIVPVSDYLKLMTAAMQVCGFLPEEGVPEEPEGNV